MCTREALLIGWLLCWSSTVSRRSRDEVRWRAFTQRGWMRIRWRDEVVIWSSAACFDFTGELDQSDHHHTLTHARTHSSEHPDFTSMPIQGCWQLPKCLKLPFVFLLVRCAGLLRWKVTSHLPSDNRFLSVCVWVNVAMHALYEKGAIYKGLSTICAFNEDTAHKLAIVLCCIVKKQYNSEKMPFIMCYIR